MPELPEVETTRRALAPRLEGEIIRSVALNRADLRYPLPGDFAARLMGKKVARLKRRGKFLIFRLDGLDLVSHLGMSGHFRLAPSGERHGKHDHVAFALDGVQIIYNDPRRFGAMDLAKRASAHLWIAKLGPEPDAASLTHGYLSRALGGRTSAIKSVLLDQHVIAGLGNIYVNEALWQARLHPLRAASSLGGGEIGRLIEAILDVIERAIKAGGSSLRDYRAPSGKLGYFQHEFRAYDQAGKPCQHQCGDKIICEQQSGRASYFCARCQGLAG